MIIKDSIYGKIDVRDSVLIDLINSNSMQRLKKVSQYGVPDKYYHFKNFYRYEHSVGVMMFLRKLGATLDEQISGLLHDVSHLAFSHVVDYVFGKGRSGNEDYQDLSHFDFINKTEIPKILEKHNIDEERILNEKNFPLLEKKSPDICADRIDYSLRELKYWLKPEIVDDCINGFIVYDNEIVFNSVESASLFAINFMRLQTEHWGSKETVTRYHLFSKALSIAIDKKYISKNDFYGDEDILLRKIEKSNSTQIQEILNILKSSKLDIRNKTKTKIIKKFRHVDPKVLIGNELKRLSEISEEFRINLEKHREINKRGVFVE